MDSNQPITADLRHVEEPKSAAIKTKQGNQAETPWDITGDRSNAAVPLQGNLLHLPNSQQGNQAGASWYIPGDRSNSTTVVATSYHQINTGNILQNRWNGLENSSLEPYTRNEIDLDKSYEIPSSAITPSKLRQVSNYLQMPNRFKPVCHQLGFKEYEIEGILYRNHNNVCEASFELLHVWYQQTGSGSAAWTKLFDALKQVVPVNQMEELHKKLMDQYVSSTSDEKEGSSKTTSRSTYVAFYPNSGPNSIFYLYIV